MLSSGGVAPGTWYGTYVTTDGAKCDLQLAPDGHELRVEFNPSRVNDPAGHSLCQPDLLLPMVRALAAALAHDGAVTVDAPDVSDLEALQKWSESVWIRRLDLAVDLEPPDPARVLSQSFIPAGKLKTVAIYKNRNGVMSAEVRRGKKHGKDILYDKHAQTRGKVPKGRLRFETQLRGDRLTKNGVRYLNGVTDDAVRRILNEGWRTLGWQLTFDDTNPLAVIAASPHSAQIKAALVGDLVAAHTGIDYGYSQATRREHQKELNALGVHDGMDLIEALQTYH